MHFDETVLVQIHVQSTDEIKFPLFNSLMLLNWIYDLNDLLK